MLPPPVGKGKRHLWIAALSASTSRFSARDVRNVAAWDVITCLSSAGCAKAVQKAHAVLNEQLEAHYRGKYLMTALLMKAHKMIPAGACHLVAHICNFVFDWSSVLMNSDEPGRGPAGATLKAG